MARCAETKADGEACCSEAMRGEPWCYSHHPRYAGQRARTASKGGKIGGRGRSSRRKEIAGVKKLTKLLIAARATNSLNLATAIHMPQIIELLRQYVKLCEIELRHMDAEERRNGDQHSLNTDALADALDDSGAVAKKLRALGG